MATSNDSKVKDFIVNEATEELLKTLVETGKVEPNQIWVTPDDTIPPSVAEDLAKVVNNTTQIVGDGNSFKAGGAATTNNGGVAIGGNTSANYGVAIGQSSVANKGGAIGQTATTADGFSGGKSASSTLGGAVGNDAKAGVGFSGGDSAKVSKIGDTYIDAIQLGTGTNSTEKTLQVYEYQLMNADGIIPSDRLDLSEMEADIEEAKNSITGLEEIIPTVIDITGE